MRFFIDWDAGTSILGWLAPDNPTETPRIIIRASGHAPVEIDAFLVRQDIVDAGLHNTGLVGFKIDEESLPGLEKSESVEIYEAKTKFCIYRRFSKDSNIEGKLILFDTSVMPQKQLLNNINKFFAFRYNFVERCSYETILTLIHCQFSKSILLTGRLQLNRYSGMLNAMDFTLAALLRDPFEELAERLLFLKIVAKSPAVNVLSGFLTGLEPAIAFASELQFTEPRQLQTAFRQMTPEQRLALANPMTRMIAGNLDERIDRRHVSVALDHLSHMHIVGTRSMFTEFSQILGDTFGANLMGDAEFESFPDAAALTDTLSRVNSVVDLLEHDLALYSFAEEAVATGLEEKQVA